MNKKEYKINAHSVRESVIDMENILGIRKDAYARYGRGLENNDFRKSNYLGLLLVRIRVMLEVEDEDPEEVEDITIFSIMDSLRAEI